jgi:hypothetical protein
MADDSNKNKYAAMWANGTVPKMSGEGDLVTFTGIDFYYKNNDNECVIKLGELINIVNVETDFKLTFGSKQKEPAKTNEFDEITLTLSQVSIDERIRTGSKDAMVIVDDTTTPKEWIEWENKKSETLETLQRQLNDLNNSSIDKNDVDYKKKKEDLELLIKKMTEMNKETVMSSDIKIFSNVTSVASDVLHKTGNALDGITQSITGIFTNKPEGGGKKRSMMSSFSRQFELPVPCHAKKRRSRSKKSRGGRRKKGKHTRKHHK